MIYRLREKERERKSKRERERGREKKRERKREKERDRELELERDIRICRSRYTKQHNIYRSIKEGNIPFFNNHTYHVTSSLPIYSTVLYDKSMLTFCTLIYHNYRYRLFVVKIPRLLLDYKQFVLNSG